MISNSSSTDSTQPSDGELLDQFVRESSELAFSKLVERYAPLVYGASLSRCGVPQLAEEAAQNTFAILARKAKSISAKEGLAGWLHQTARYEASKIIRSEFRHFRKMNALSNDPTANSASRENWEEMRPLLDDAIDRLPKGDRNLLLMRYYHGFSFPEIASKTGKTLAATQKRSQRALAKLETYLRKGGITGTTAVIAATLTGALHSPLKAGFAKDLASSSLATSSSISGGTLLSHSIAIMSVQKITVVSTVVVIGLALVPLGYQRIAISREKNRIAELEESSRNSSMESEENSVSRSSKEGSGGDSRTRKISDHSIRVELDLSRLAEDLLAVREQQSVAAMVRTKDALAVISSLSDERVDELFDRVKSLDLEGQSRDLLIDAILGELQETRPGKAMEIIGGFLRKAAANSDQRFMVMAERTLENLAAVEPERAKSWYESAMKEGLFDAKALGDHESGRDRASASLFAGLFEINQPEALVFFDSLGENARLSSLKKIASKAEDEAAHNEFIGLASKLPEEKNRIALNSLARGIAKQLGPGESTASILNAVSARAEVAGREELLVEAAHSIVEDRLTRIDETLDWVRKYSDSDAAENNLGLVLGRYATFEQTAGYEKFKSIRESGADDAFAAAFIQSGERALRDPVGTLELINTFTDSELRTISLNRFSDTWRAKDPEQFSRYLRESPLSESEQTRLLQK